MVTLKVHYEFVFDIEYFSTGRLGTLKSSGPPDFKMEWANGEVAWYNPSQVQNKILSGEWKVHRYGSEVVSIGYE